MERLPNQKYTKEFKEETVRMVNNEKITQIEAARRLQISKETLHGWLKKYRALGTVADKQKGYEASGLEAENAQLRRELAEARMERDILKKATAYLQKSRCEVRVHKSNATPISHKNNVPGT